MQRIFIIHGWGGSPKGDWMLWAKRVLTEKGYEVFVPEMPDTEHPKIGPWIEKMKKTVGVPRPDDFFIGHSIGCQTILRYLKTLSEGIKVGKVILVAPWWYLTLDENEAQADADSWLKMDVNFEKVKSKAGKFVAVFSDNDPWVPIEENLEYFKEKLNPEIVVKNKMGHFTADEGSTELPLLLEPFK